MSYEILPEAKKRIPKLNNGRIGFSFVINKKEVFIGLQITDVGNKPISRAMPY